MIRKGLLGLKKDLNKGRAVLNESSQADTNGLNDISVTP
jgi:hypothetical protein